MGKNSIAKNSKVLTISYGISKIINYGWGIIIARMMSLEEFGLFSYIITIGAFLDILSDLGTSNYILRKFSKENTDIHKIITTTFIVRSSIFMTLIIVSSLLLSDSWLVALLILLSYYFQNITNMFNSFFRSQEQMNVEANTIVLVRFVLLLMTIIAYFFDTEKLFLLSLVMVLSNLLGFLYITYKYYVHLKKDISFSKVYLADIKLLVLNSLPFALTIILTTLYYRIDVFFLEKISGMEEVGLYNAAFKFIDISLIIPMVLVTPILPILARSYESENNLFKSMLKRYVGLLSVIGTLGALGIDIFSKPVILISYGEQYSGAILILVILGYTLFFQFINYIIEYSLNVSNLQRFVNYNAVLGILINVSFCFIVIPIYGGIGAAYATVFTAFLMNIVNVFYLIFILKVKPNNSLIISYIGVIGIFVSNFMFTGYIYLFIKIIFLVLIFIVTIKNYKKTVLQGGNIIASDNN
ncbi:flippase [Niallia taxi]|uniref:flippase n=1 Tax=Niallia taxi TaxID=2499688 RepID=UPI00300BD93F